MKKPRASAIKVRLWDLVSDAVERGVSRGWYRAHKHVDRPSEELLKQKIEDEVMNTLSEVIDWEN